MSSNTLIGRNLQRYREQSGLTQEALAQYLGISREEVSYYETGKRTFPTRLITDAVRLFGIDEYDLLETDPESSKVKIALAFRAGDLSTEDLRHIADFRKIVLNYVEMRKILSHDNPRP